MDIQSTLLVPVRNYFLPKEVGLFTGASYRRIQYWDKTGLVKPSFRRRGKYRLYTWRDLFEIFLVMKLNASIQQSRKFLPRLRVRMATCSDDLLMDSTLIVSRDLARATLARRDAVVMDASDKPDVLVPFYTVVHTVRAYDAAAPARRAADRALAIDRYRERKRKAERTPYTEALQSIGIDPIADGGSA